MADFIYNGYRFTPAPLMSYSRERIRDDNNKKLFDRISLTCEGSLLNSDTSFKNLDTAYFIPLKNALSEDYKELVISHTTIGNPATYTDGVFASGVYPSVEDFSIDESTWAYKVDYSFSLSWDDVTTGSEVVESYGEDWDYNEEENNTLSVTHTIEAKGLNTNPNGINNSLTNAQNFVSSKTVEAVGGFPDELPCEVFKFYTNKSYIKQLTQESSNKSDGTFSLTENFLLGSGIEITHIHRNSFDFSTDQNKITTVNVTGEIRGGGNSPSDKALNSISAWNTVKSTLYPSASGVYYTTMGFVKILSKEPVSESVTRDENSGVITYTRTYSDKINDINATNIIDASYSISKTNPTPVVASVPIPGKPDGPVWQRLNTVTEGQYTLSGQVIGTTLVDAIAYAQYLINAHGGQSVGFESRITAHSFDRDNQNNSVSFNITWTFRGDEASSLLM